MNNMYWSGIRPKKGVLDMSQGPIFKEFNSYINRPILDILKPNKCWIYTKTYRNNYRNLSNDTYNWILGNPISYRLGSQKYYTISIFAWSAQFGFFFYYWVLKKIFHLRSQLLDPKKTWVWV